MRASVFGSLIVTYAVFQTVIILLLVRFADPYEREPMAALAVMGLWGALGATSLSAAGNVAIGRLLPLDVQIVFGNAISAPVVEELAKGAALVAFVALSVSARGRFGIPRFEGVTDGIVYGAAIGLGFAFTEDILFLLVGASQGGLESGLVTFLARRDFFGLSPLHHLIYTGAFGVGLGLATWARSKLAKIALPAAGLALGIVLHAINNGLVQLVLVIKYGFQTTAQALGPGVAGPLADQISATSRQVVGVVRFLDFALVVAYVGAIQLWLRYQRRVIREELAEEVTSGLISRTELELMPAYWKRTFWYWRLIRNGQWERWRLLRRIHNELVDLAFLKRRVKTGRADGNDVGRSKQLIEKLKAQKVVFL